MSTATWQIGSSPRKDGLLGAGCLAVGLLILWLVQSADTSSSNGAAAAGLGLLLAGIGVAALVAGEEVEVTVDSARRVLHVERATRWSRTAVDVPFREVAAVHVARVGSRSDGTPSFRIALGTTDGRRHDTGYWSLDEAETVQLAERLAGEIGCACRHAAPPVPATAIHVALAAAGAVALYAGWYRATIGPWCPAMWFGTAPVLVILLSFAGLLGLARRVVR